MCSITISIASPSSPSPISFCISVAFKLHFTSSLHQSSISCLYPRNSVQFHFTKPQPAVRNPQSAIRSPHTTYQAWYLPKLASIATHSLFLSILTSLTVRDLPRPGFMLSDCLLCLFSPSNSSQVNFSLLFPSLSFFLFVISTSCTFSRSSRAEFFWFFLLVLLFSPALHCGRVVRNPTVNCLVASAIRLGHFFLCFLPLFTLWLPPSFSSLGAKQLWTVTSQLMGKNGSRLAAARKEKW